MKRTFWEISQQIMEDAPPSNMDSMGGGPPMGGGLDSTMGGGPPMGGGMPPMGGVSPVGDMGGLGGPGMGMGGPPMGGSPNGGQKTTPIQLKPIDVWSVINRILDGKSINIEKEKKSVQSDANPVQSNNSPVAPPNIGVNQNKPLDPLQ